MSRILTFLISTAVTTMAKATWTKKVAPLLRARRHKHDTRLPGIDAFFSKHQCNPICEHLRIGRCVEHKFGLGTLAPARPQPAAAGGFKQSPQPAR